MLNENDLNEQLSAVLSGVVGGLKISRDDPDFSIYYLSESVASIQGYGVDEFLMNCSGSIRQNCYEEDRLRVDKEITLQYGKGDTYKVKYRVRHKNGNLIWIQDSGKRVRTSDGKVFHYSLIQDINEQQLLQEQLESERQQFREVLAKDALCILSFDVTAGIVEKPFYNDNNLSFFNLGITFPTTYNKCSKIFLEKMNVEFMDNEGALFFIREGLLSKFEEGVVSEDVEYYIKTNDSYIRALFLLSKNHIDNHVLCTVFFYDVTASRRNELMEQQYLRDALKSSEQAVRAKNLFLSNMSHDIRTPLNAIMGYSSIAQISLDNEDKVSDYLGKIQASGKSLLNMLNNVLDMSRIESGREVVDLETVNLKDLLLGLKIMISSEIDAKKMNYDLFLDSVNHSEIRSDGSKIRRIMENLVTNAVKYTNEGGRISVEAVEKELDNKSSYYTIKVSDNGVGMSKDFLENRLFKSFEREKNTTISGIAGSGLGLAIAKSLAEMMGGTLVAESTEGKGSCFIFSAVFQYSAVS